MRANKHGKTELIWDRDKRVEFVTGFKKRKDERRKVAKEKCLKEAADARIQARKERGKEKERIEEQYEQIKQILKIHGFTNDKEGGDSSSDEKEPAPEKPEQKEADVLSEESESKYEKV